MDFTPNLNGMGGKKKRWALVECFKKAENEFNKEKKKTRVFKK